MNFVFITVLRTIFHCKYSFTNKFKAMKPREGKGDKKNNPRVPPEIKHPPGKQERQPSEQSPDKRDIPDEIPEREIKRTPANPQDKSKK